MAATDIKIIVSANTSNASAGMRRLGTEVNAASTQSGLLGGQLLGVATALVGVATAGEAFSKVVNLLDDYKKSTISIAASLTDTIKRPGADLSAIFKQNLYYAEETYNMLELASRKFFASGKEMVEAWEVLSNKGVRLTSAADINNLGIIVDRIKLATKGQSTSLQIAQEIRSVMNGQARMTDQVAMMLKDRLGPAWVYALEKAREQGRVLEFLASQFKGMQLASDAIAMSWENQYTAFTSLASQVVRSGLTIFYEDLVKSMATMNNYLIAHRKEIGEKIKAAYLQLKDIIQVIADNKSSLLVVLDVLKVFATIVAPLMAIKGLVNVAMGIFGRGGIIAKAAGFVNFLTKGLGAAIGGLAGTIATGVAASSGKVGIEALAIGNLIGSKVAAGVAKWTGALVFAPIVWEAGYSIGQSLAKNVDIIADFVKAAAATISVLFDSAKEQLARIGLLLKATFEYWTGVLGDLMVSLWDVPIAYWKDKLLSFFQWWLQNSKLALGSMAPEWMNKGLSYVNAAKEKSSTDLANANANNNIPTIFARQQAIYDSSVAKIPDSTINVLDKFQELFAALTEDRYNPPPAAMAPEAQLTDPPASTSDASRISLEQDLLAMAEMRKEMLAVIAQKQQDPYAAELTALLKKINDMLIGPNSAQPILSEQRQAEIKTWAAQGQPAVTAESMNLNAAKNAAEAANNLQLVAIQQQRMEAGYATLQVAAEMWSSVSADINRRQAEDEQKTVDSIMQERERMQKALAAMNGTRLDQIRENTDFELAQEEKRINGIKAKTAREIAEKKALLAEFAIYQAAKNKEVSDMLSNDLMGGFARGIKDFTNALKSGFEYAREIAADTAKAMSQGFSDFFFDVFQRKMKSLTEYLIAFLTSIQRSIAQAMGDAMTKKVLGGITSAFANGITTGGNASANTPASPSFAFANGGIAPGGFRAFASGGTVSQPTLGLVGEGQYNEAVVPLPDGKRIPVQLKGGGGAPQVTVNIINQSGTPVAVKQQGMTWDAKTQRLVLSLIADSAARDRDGFGSQMRSALGVA